MVYFQQSLFGKMSWERFHQITGWILEPSYPLSQTPMFQCLLLEDGQEPEWCEGERLTSAGGSWTPSIGQAYFYCRVAHDDSFSLERQAEELRRYAEQAGYTIVGAAAEHGSGMTLDRPALQEVMKAVLAGKVDVVLISSLDRIGRDWGMTKQYIALLTEPKVKLLCLRERVSSDISGASPFST